MAAKWDSDNMACKATWAILSAWMNQVVTPFDEATSPNITMGQLRYWPKSAIDSTMMSGLAFGMAHQFLILVQDNYAVQREDPKAIGLSIIRKVQKIFATKTATLADLAAKVDSVLLFAGEKAS